MLTTSSRPQEIATIIVGKETFKVYKALLVKDSGYFDKALNGPFVEGQTQTINLGDGITSAEFGVYIDVLHRSYLNRDFQFRPECPTAHGASECLQSLRAWRIADRFLNKYLLDIFQESFTHYMDTYSVSSWEFRYKSFTFADGWHKDALEKLQALFQYCALHNLPQKDEVARCAAAAPMQLILKHHDDLDIAFRTEVMKKVAKRFENPLLKQSFMEVQGDPPSRPVKRKCLARKKLRDHQEQSPSRL